jgi:hypothetical protein
MESDHYQEASSQGRPIDYAFRFVYFSGGMPPVDYYELVIEVAPDGSGEIHFQRDYEANRPEEFVAVFDAEDAALDHVYRMMLSGGICEPIWQPPPRRKENSGGQSARLDVTCGGNFFEITPARFDVLGEAGTSLIEAIRGLVPEATWAKIEKFQRPKP